ncbi:MAG: ABC transporter permease, partial [Myxococcales bacterium]|nr:ABC transporter permease [Myxococcales bacterium]
PPFDLLFIPILLALDLCLLGFMFGAVMLLQDKQNNTIAALRVTPATAWDYLGAKLLVNLGLSALNLLVLVGVAAPAFVLEPLLWLLVLLACMGMTALGMAIAVFIRSIAQFFYPLMLVGLLASTPLYMVFEPTAALSWTRALPTYQLLFGSEALLFAGDPALVAEALIYLGCFALVATLLCTALVHARLLRPA